MRLLLLLAPAVSSDPIPVVRLFVEGPAAQPAVAVSPEGNVYVVAVRERRIGFLGTTDPVPTDAGEPSWSAPVEVAPGVPVPGSMRRGPRIAFARGSVVITTPTAGRGDEEGNLVAFRSDDGGRTWSPGVRVNDAPRSASEGFHDLAATEGGDLFVAWLDCRTYARGQEIWCSRSADGGRTWSKNVRAYASPEKTVCECCPIAVAAGEKGAVGVVFRNWLAGARDPYLLLSKDGGKRFASPVKLGSGTWRVAACPMMEGGGGFTGEAVVCLAGRDGRLELVRPGSWEKPLGAGIRPAVAGGPDRLFFAYREGESGPLLVGSATPGGEVEPRLLAPPGPGISRDFPAFGASRGIVALAFEEREGNASPRVGLAFLARRRGP